jgi:zinc protease
MTRTRLLSRWRPVRAGFALLAAAAVSVSAGQERFRKSPPLPDPLQEIQLPVLDSYPLSMNGLVVTVAPQKGSPLVLIQLVFAAGLRHSPENLPALASFAARMMGRGSGTLSAEEVEARIESLGGEFSISVLMDYTVIGLRVVREHLDPALALLSSMAIEPSFRDREIETLKRTIFYETRAELADPEVFGRWELLRLLFENHPYSRAGFNEDSVMSVSHKSIVEFARKFYQPRGAGIVISGDTDLNSAVQAASHYFNTWGPGEADVEPLPPVVPNNRERIAFVDFPEIADALVFVGNSIPDLTGPDYYPYLVLDHILGGSTRSRLFMNLRESKGYAFNAFSDFAFYRLNGMYWAQARLTPAALLPGIREVLSELASLARDRISPVELEEAKGFLIGNLPLKFESPPSFAELVSRQFALGLGDGHWGKLAENLIRVNAGKAREVAQRVFSPKPVVLVLGRKELLLEQLTGSFESVEIYDLKGVHVQTFIEGEIK